MNTIRITRGNEKFYRENRIKVYVNDNFVVELKQKESKDIQIATETVEVFAKTSLFYKSPTEIFQCEENSEIEVIMNPSFRIHPIQISLLFIPIYIAIIIQCENIYVKIAASIVLLSLFIGEIIQTKRVMKKGILISKK